MPSAAFDLANAAPGRVLARLRDPLGEQRRIAASFAPLRALFAKHPQVFTGEFQGVYPGIDAWLDGQDPAYVRQLAEQARTALYAIVPAIVPHVPVVMGLHTSSAVTYLGAGVGGALHGLTGSSVASAIAAGLAALTALGGEDPDVREGARAVGRGIASGLVYLVVRDAALRAKARA